MNFRFFPLLILMLFSSTCFAEDTPIRLGAMLHLTGEFSIQGEAFRQGAELAQDTINSSGGINGKKLEVVFEDTQYKPLTSNTVAKKLSSDKSILGNIISTLTETKASANVLEKNKLPSIVLWDSSPELDKTGEFIFSIGPWAPASGEKSAEFAVNKLKAKKAVIINVQTEWSVYVSSYFESKFKELGGEVLYKIDIDPNERDFRTVLLKARNSNPDVIYAPIDSNILPFFKQVKEYELKIPLITSDILDKELFDAGGDLFEGIYQSQSSNPDFPATKLMLEAYRKKYSKDPDYLMYTSWAYDGIMILAEAIKNGGMDREKIKESIYKIKDFQGASGVISFTTDGSAPREVKIYNVNGQKLVVAE
jgi:branched-chain amino acid transport system substrate-binding protein